MFIKECLTDYNGAKKQKQKAVTGFNYSKKNCVKSIQVVLNIKGTRVLSNMKRDVAKSMNRIKCQCM